MGLQATSAVLVGSSTILPTGAVIAVFVFPGLLYELVAAPPFFSASLATHFAYPSVWLG